VRLHDTGLVICLLLSGCLETNSEWDAPPRGSESISGGGEAGSSSASGGSAEGMSSQGDTGASGDGDSGEGITGGDGDSGESVTSGDGDGDSSAGDGDGDGGGNSEPYGACPSGGDSECATGEICITGTIDAMDWSLCTSGACTADAECDLDMGDTCESLPGDDSTQEFCVSQVCDTQPCPAGMHCGTGVNADVCVWPV
jgi:hypothetical protein